MTSNSPFQGITSPSRNTPTVPMSVYRELAGELQAAQQQLNGLKQDNQHLHQENQSLRLEIKKLVQSVQTLENTRQYWEQKSPHSTQPNEKDDLLPSSSSQQTWLSHQQDHYPQQLETDHTKGEINGWFVISALVMIVFTFSGIGFMVARPLLNQSGDQ